MENHLTTFLGVSALIVVTPGPDMALTFRNTLLGGRKGGVLTAAGVAVGQILWVAATSAGVTALILASEQVFTAIRFVGAAYLVFLGARTLLCAIGSPGPALGAFSNSPARPISSSGAFRQGIISNLSNPTAGAFFLSVLPQFAPRAGAPGLTLVLLGLVFALLTISWLTACAFLVARAGDFLFRPIIRRALQGLTGASLVALSLLTLERTWSGVAQMKPPGIS